MKYTKLIKLNDNTKLNVTLSEQFQSPIIKVIERGKIDTPDTQRHS